MKDQASTPFLGTGGLKTYENRDEKHRNFNQIAEILPNKNIYIPLEEGRKHSIQSGWNEKRNLISKEQAESHIEAGGNVGVALGQWFNGSTYVLFDVERKDTLPEDIRALLDPYATLIDDSPHTGRNRLVRIDDRDVYELLDSYQKTITDITADNEDDLELMTNGGTPLPPSEIDHSHCSDEKPCDGHGTDEYITDTLNPEAPSLGIDTIEELGDMLGIQPKQIDEPPTTEAELEDIPSAYPVFDPEEEFNENVPSVSHTFNDRFEYMKYGEWDGQEAFIRLWNGDFSEVSGSNKQGRGEMKLANKIGFFFGKNERMVRLCMAQAPFDSYYEKYPNHRKNLLEYATSVDWCYCDNVRLGKKYTVAEQIYIDEETTIKELTGRTVISERHVRRIIEILEAEGVVDISSEKRTKIIRNELITEGYLTRLANIAEDIPDNTTKVFEDTDNSNIEKVSI